MRPGRTNAVSAIGAGGRGFIKKVGPRACELYLYQARFDPCNDCTFVDGITDVGQAGQDPFNFCRNADCIANRINSSGVFLSKNELCLKIVIVIF
jgi:hypothetical protein